MILFAATNHGCLISPCDRILYHVLMHGFAPPLSNPRRLRLRMSESGHKIKGILGFGAQRNEKDT